MALILGPGTILAILVLIAWRPFMGGPVSDAPKRDFARADDGCIAAWNATGPRDELSRFETSVVVERVDGVCRVHGLNSHRLAGGRWVRTDPARVNWYNARHTADGRLVAAPELLPGG